MKKTVQGRTPPIYHVEATPPFDSAFALAGNVGVKLDAVSWLHWRGREAVRAFTWMCHLSVGACAW